MKLIQSIAPAVLQGATIRLTLSAASADKLQLDILPAGKENKANIVLPPKSLIGTAAELDAGLEQFMEAYGSTLNTVAGIASSTDNELRRLEDEAQALSKAALEAKRSTNSSKPKTVTKSAAGKPARDLNAGLATGSDDDDDGSAGGGDGTSDDEAVSTTLDTSDRAASTEPTTPVVGAAGLTPSMF